MNMSKAVRRQLLAADLVRGVVEACRAAGQLATTPEGSAILARLERLGEQGAAYAYGATDPEGRWHLDARSTRAYSVALEAVRAEIHARYGEGVDARTYLAAVLVWVEDLRASLPPTRSERRLTWFRVAEQLQALADLLDRSEDAVDQGAEHGEAFKDVAGVW